VAVTPPANRLDLPPAGKPEAQAEGIRVAPPDIDPHSLSSRFGLHGTDTDTATHRNCTARTGTVAHGTARAVAVTPPANRLDLPPAGKPEAQAEGIRVAPPEIDPHSLSSRFGLHGTDTATQRNRYSTDWHVSGSHMIIAHRRL
jgi:hypothetical protein